MNLVFFSPLFNYYMQSSIFFHFYAIELFSIFNPVHQPVKLHEWIITHLSHLSWNCLHTGSQKVAEKVHIQFVPAVKISWTFSNEALSLLFSFFFLQGFLSILFLFHNVLSILPSTIVKLSTKHFWIISLKN